MLSTLVHPRAATTAPATRKGRGRFLGIGLDRLDPAHYGTDGALQSAEADARDVAEILVGRGFMPHPVRITGHPIAAGPGLILRQAATRSHVITEINAMAQASEPGDLVVLHYSGHGGQVPDESGDEADGLDETWCLYDGQLIDDELQALLGRFRAGVGVIVFSDSCHSGTVSRARITTAANQVAAADDGVALAGAGEVPTPVFRTLPPEDLVDTYRRNRDFYRQIAAEVRAESPRGDRAAVRCDVVQLAGCQDNQLSLDGPFNGLFTGTWKAIFAGGVFSGSLADLHRRTVKRMPPTQTPNLLGTGPGWTKLAGGRALTLE